MFSVSETTHQPFTTMQSMDNSTYIEMPSRAEFTSLTNTIVSQDELSSLQHKDISFNNLQNGNTPTKSQLKECNSLQLAEAEKTKMAAQLDSQDRKKGLNTVNLESLTANTDQCNSVNDNIAKQSEF